MRRCGRCARAGPWPAGPDRERLGGGASRSAGVGPGDRTVQRAYPFRASGPHLTQRRRHHHRQRQTDPRSHPREPPFQGGGRVDYTAGRGIMDTERSTGTRTEDDLAVADVRPSSSPRRQARAAPAAPPPSAPRGPGPGPLGAGPDDHPLMRSLRNQSRAEGLAEGERRGRAEGGREAQARMARQILRSRGLEASEDFPAGATAFAASSDEAIAAAALACSSERDFLARLDRALGG